MEREIIEIGDIAILIKEKRIKIGLSQSTLSLLAEVDRSWINRYENHKIARPNLETVMKLLDALQIKLILTQT
jgi:transcriptional regulator with XRE-family HTH domain